MEKIIEILAPILTQMEASLMIRILVKLTIFFILVFFINLVVRKLITSQLEKAAYRLKKGMETYIKKNKFFAKMRYVVLLTLTYFALPIFFIVQKQGFFITQKIISILLIIAIVRFVGAGLNLLYRAFPAIDGVATKGIFQTVKILTYIIGIVLLISISVSQHPLTMVAGLAGLTAILMLIFKDSILGFVAGLQIAMNDMLKLGDWIEVPNEGADGTVIDISLTTIKVQNWDNTIVSVPAYSLVTSSFKNWEGMSRSGVRRVARNINIDMNSIKFLDKNTIEELKKIDILKDYLSKKEKEIAKDNKDKNTKENLFNGRYLTNIGTFRAYCEAYLNSRSFVDKASTKMVRQLAPTPEGLPLQIYAFLNTTEWVKYEGLQSDIFDHIISVIPEFGLKIFQKPSGKDFAKILNK